ncbi:MAG: hypothetical protein HYT42_02470 [Candidatus Sungbacteria bacterium]|nr:hypothetical protein [Candidatus Sungbacteria bacterium]
MFFGTFLLRKGVMILRIIAVISVHDRGVEWDGWVLRREWDSNDPKLAPLLRGVALIIPLDGQGYEMYIRRFRDALTAVEAAWQEGGCDEARRVIERWRKALFGIPVL